MKFVFCFLWREPYSDVLLSEYMAHGNIIGIGEPSIFGAVGFLTKYQIFILYLSPRQVPRLWEKYREK